ncbi:MAG TPA: glycosyltransferase family 4 protein [Candidatus Thalassarchaeaceae archaeon]|nr:MAG TPA: glycosyltransferase [Candidatus Poseidoniales archaeon]HIH80017.1 glycosyltransferase family 4 protein [Candidatus Thalassarchaeaceae archaeon]
MTGNAESSGRRRLLVAKGTFEAMRGAERDLIRNLPALAQEFDVTVATLQPSKELKNCIRKHSIPLLYPDIIWKPSTGTIARILNSDLKSSLKSWKSISGLKEVIDEVDAVHLVSGDGSFGLIRIIPKKKAFHLHMLEPHRGLYEDVLHLDVKGEPKRNMGLTKFALSKAKRDDLRVINHLIKRQKSRISGNSSYSASRIEDVYGCEAGFIHPSIDYSEYTTEATKEENEVWIELDELPDPPWITTIGHSGWVKGTWETISMLTGSGLGLVLVGGGVFEELEELQDYADARGVRFWIAPRLSNLQLTGMMRRSVAVVSMAHGEPFGLTPIEAFAVGTPALFVDEGGFRDSIEDGVNGRLLPRDDPAAWQEALKEAMQDKTRKKWTKAGREKIASLDLSPERHAKRVSRIIEELLS